MIRDTGEEGSDRHDQGQLGRKGQTDDQVFRDSGEERDRQTDDRDSGEERDR